MAHIERQIRTGLMVTVGALTVIAWWITYYQVQNMGLLMRVGVPMSLGMEGGATPSSFLLFTGMWSVMMTAMMLPSTYPILLLHRTVSRSRSASAGATLVFAVSYFFTWIAAGTAFYWAYIWIGALRAAWPQADPIVLRAAGLALLAAGGYQWSPTKWACLKHCQNPLHFVMEHWQPGRKGAARMGFIHGLYCFGCCWGLMVILFVMGIMHLGWMAAIGAVILLEKVLPYSQWITKAVGAVVVSWGVVVLFRPEVLLWLSSQIMIR